jgi:hypothetical protein
MKGGEKKMKRKMILTCISILVFCLTTSAYGVLLLGTNQDNDQVHLIDTLSPNAQWWTWIGWIPGQPIAGIGFDSYNATEGIVYTGGWSRENATDYSLYGPPGAPMVAPIAPGIYNLPAPYNTFNETTGNEVVRDLSTNTSRSFAVELQGGTMTLLEFSLNAAGAPVGVASSTPILNNGANINAAPWSLAWDEADQKFVTTNSNGKIWEFGLDGAATNVSTFVGPGWIRGLAWGPDGIMYASTSDVNAALVQLNVHTGASVVLGTQAQAGINQGLSSLYTPLMGIPEPGVISLMLTSLAGIFFLGKKRK